MIDTKIGIHNLSVGELAHYASFSNDPWILRFSELVGEILRSMPRDVHVDDLPYNIEQWFDAVDEMKNEAEMARCDQQDAEEEIESQKAQIKALRLESDSRFKEEEATWLKSRIADRDKDLKKLRENIIDNIAEIARINRALEAKTREHQLLEEKQLICTILASV